ncbi:MAG: DUF4406 domain-containing protein [Deltaproteobacteria bacterium]|nr:DUF4406 domain-containing protein [Deltaproteobacteria bacterium]
MRRVYIAGPMRGYANFNFDAFDAARDRLRAQGWIVVSPADLDRAYEGWGAYPPEDLVVDRELQIRCISRDLAAIQTFDKTKGDAIYLLKGWQKSAGALAELALAQFLGLEVYVEDRRDHVLLACLADFHQCAEAA